METKLKEGTEAIYLIPEREHLYKIIFHKLVGFISIFSLLIYSYFIPFLVFLIVSRFTELNIYLFCIIYALMGLAFLIVALIGDRIESNKETNDK